MDAMIGSSNIEKIDVVINGVNFGEMCIYGVNPKIYYEFIPGRNVTIVGHE